MKDFVDEFPKKQTNKYNKKEGYGNKFQKQTTIVREPEPQPNILINTKDEAGFIRQTQSTTNTNTEKITSIGSFARKNLEAENV